MKTTLLALMIMGFLAHAEEKAVVAASPSVSPASASPSPAQKAKKKKVEKKK